MAEEGHNKKKHWGVEPVWEYTGAGSRHLLAWCNGRVAPRGLKDDVNREMSFSPPLQEASTHMSGCDVRVPLHLVGLASPIAMHPAMRARTQSLFDKLMNEFLWAISLVACWRVFRCQSLPTKQASF